MKTAADVLIETLIKWGVEVIFGFPGDGINGIFESLRTHAEEINFVQVQHEEAAACSFPRARAGTRLRNRIPGVLVGSHASPIV